MRAYVLIGPRYVAEHKLSDRQAALCYFVGLDEFHQCYLFIHGTTQRLIRSAYATFMPTDPTLLSDADFDPRDSWLPDRDADPVAALNEPRLVDDHSMEGDMEEYPWSESRLARAAVPARDAGPEPVLMPARAPAPYLPRPLTLLFLRLLREYVLFRPLLGVLIASNCSSPLLTLVMASVAPLVLVPPPLCSTLPLLLGSHMDSHRALLLPRYPLLLNL
jgi:hypothetical protein